MWAVGVLPAASLWLAVAALRPVEGGLRRDLTVPTATLAGNGATLAALGGTRAVLAGAIWLKVNLAWERRDPAATTALVHLAVAADERPLTFWLNGARMLAYDVAVWRTSDDAPAAVRRRVVLEQGEAALQLLEQGTCAHGPAPELYVEMANIRLRALGDREGAARWFRQAAELPGAPFYAARIHAELLLELGRPDEALAWLRKILPSLPPDDLAAQRDAVLARIKGLEQELGRK